MRLDTACAHILLHVPLYRPVRGAIPAPVHTPDLHLLQMLHPGSGVRGRILRIWYFLGLFEPLRGPDEPCYAGDASEVSVGPLRALSV